VSDVGIGPGLAFFVASLATIALGAAGLVIQPIVVATIARGSPRWGARIAAAALGPSIALAFGAVCAVAIEEASLARETEELLDSVALAVPAIAVATWVGAQVALARQAK
jgi:hypothetical protein